MANRCNSSRSLYKLQWGECVCAKETIVNAYGKSCTQRKCVLHPESRTICTWSPDYPDQSVQNTNNNHHFKFYATHYHIFSLNKINRRWNSQSSTHYIRFSSHKVLTWLIDKDRGLKVHKPTSKVPKCQNTHDNNPIQARSAKWVHESFHPPFVNKRKKWNEKHVKHHSSTSGTSSEVSSSESESWCSW